MKKFLIMFVAVLMLVTTGCGSSKKLECSLEEDGQTSKYVMEFDGDQVSKITMTLNMPFEETLSAEEKEYMESYMGLMCSMYDYEGVECKTNTSNSAVTVEIKMNFGKMSDETKSTLGFTDTSATYEELKKDAEADGYTCK